MEEKQAIQALAALAQESRLNAFRFLIRSGPRGAAAGEIARELRIPAPTLSFHLKELARAGLIVDRREGRSIIYGLSVAGVRSLLAFLLEDCCCGRPELCQPAFIDIGAGHASSPPRKPRRQVKTK